MRLKPNSNRNKPFYILKNIPAPKHDIEVQLDEFETRVKVRTISEYRQRILLGSANEKCRHLAAILASCTRHFYCRSAACPRCAREFRRWFYQEVSRLYDQFTEAYTGTLVPYKYLTHKELYSLRVETFKNTLGQELRRVDVDYPVIGSLEIDYHPEMGKWLPHFHLLFLGKRSPIEKLRKKYKEHLIVEGRSAKVNRPLRIEVIRDKGKQLSYLYKSYWKRIETYKNKHGKRETDPYRLIPKHLRLCLLVQHRVGFTGFLFLYGLRRFGNRIRTN